MGGNCILLLDLCREKSYTSDSLNYYFNKYMKMEYVIPVLNYLAKSEGSKRKVRTEREIFNSLRSTHPFKTDGADRKVISELLLDMFNNGFLFIENGFYRIDRDSIKEMDKNIFLPITSTRTKVTTIKKIIRTNLHVFTCM